MTAQHHGRRGRPWRRIREQVLARDPYCKIRGPRCTRFSTTVDHIIPLSQRPDLAHVLSNLRGACSACNSAGGARIATAKRKAARNGAYSAHRQAMVAATTARTAVSCKFHANCGSVHSRPWSGGCRGTPQQRCIDACAAEVPPVWCRLADGGP